MKKILLVLISLSSLMTTMYGQSDNYIRPSAIGISFFLNDFATASRIRSTSLSQVLNNKQIAKMRDMTPGLGIHYFQGLTNHVDFAGNIGASFLRYPLPNKSFSSESFLLEASATVNLKMVSDKYWVQPYLIAGVGGSMYRGYFGAFIPTGLGVKVNFFDEAHLFITSTYRIPVTLETSNYHFQHSIGIAGVIKKKADKVITPPPPPPSPPVTDRDGDGVPDNIDKCPDVKGLARYQGCPIPDTDNDGINDEEDKCPTVPGLARYQGCPIPDSDGDGINDEEDKCPKVPGVARYQGCPIPDTDGDGVNDEEDKCVTIPGSKDNFGCPIITEEVKKKVNMAANSILFVTGSAKLESKSFKGLNEVSKIMSENPDMLIAIDGHTDNVGKEEKNQALSQSRADAVKAYLVSKGVSESRISATGHGSSMPVADNKTAAGRQNNRRSELTLSYFK